MLKLKNSADKTMLGRHRQDLPPGLRFMLRSMLSCFTLTWPGGESTFPLLPTGDGGRLVDGEENGVITIPVWIGDCMLMMDGVGDGTGEEEIFSSLNFRLAQSLFAVW